MTNKRPLLATIGDVTWDTTVRPSECFVRGDQSRADIVDSVGGSSAIVAHNASILGAHVRFIGQAGEDEEGRRGVMLLRSAGVEVDIVKQEGQTARILLMVLRDSERSIVRDSRSVASWETDILEPICDDLFRSVQILHMEGWELFDQRSKNAWMYVAKAAHEQGISITIDACSAARIQEGGVKEYLQAIAEMRPAILFVNGSEAEILDIGNRPPSGVDLVIAHNGIHPTRLIGTAVNARVPVQDIVRKPVDMSGAGDTFAAGFLAAWIQGILPVQAVIAGHQAAAKKVQRLGCLLGREDTELEEHET